jgi:hypothetical protein
MPLCKEGGSVVDENCARGETDEQARVGRGKGEQRYGRRR